MGNSLTSFVRPRYSICIKWDSLKSVMRSQKLITFTSIKIASVLNRTFSSFFSQTASFLGPMAQLCHRYSNLAHTVWVDLFPQLWNLLTEKQQQVSYEILPTLVKRNNVFLTRSGSTRQRIENNKIQCLTLREFDVKFHAKKPIQVFSREIEHRIYKYSWKRNFSYFVRVWYQYTCTS